MTAGAPVIAARGVGRRFGSRTALQPTDVDVLGGEVLALIGPNGAGKSTLLSLLAGALAPSCGTVELRAGARTGWMPQRPAHYGRLSARQNLELFARLEGLSDPSRLAAAVLQRYEIPADGRPSGSLSLGNRQRLNLAIATLGDPDVLLLDEPTASLDPRQRRRLLELARRRADAGGAVVLATQLVDELDLVAHHVLMLVEGAVAFEGTLDAYRASGAEELLA